MPSELAANAVTLPLCARNFTTGSGTFGVQSVTDPHLKADVRFRK